MQAMQKGSGPQTRLSSGGDSQETQEDCICLSQAEREAIAVLWDFVDGLPEHYVIIPVNEAKDTVERLLARFAEGEGT